METDRDAYQAHALQIPQKAVSITTTRLVSTLTLRHRAAPRRGEDGMGQGGNVHIAPAHLLNGNDRAKAVLSVRSRPLSLSLVV